jgi:hypothetical protein
MNEKARAVLEQDSRRPNACKEAWNWYKLGLQCWFRATDTVFKYVGWCILFGLVFYAYRQAPNWHLLAAKYVLFLLLIAPILWTLVIAAALINRVKQKKGTVIAVGLVCLLLVLMAVDAGYGIVLGTINALVATRYPH